MSPTVSPLDEALDAMPTTNRTTTAEALAEKLGWSTARARWALVQLRQQGFVKYDRAYRMWERAQ